MRPGETSAHHPGGAFIAKAAGVPVVPVALDSGKCWPRGGFLKRAGVVNVQVGPPIDTAENSPRRNNPPRKGVDGGAYGLGFGVGKINSGSDARSQGWGAAKGFVSESVRTMAPYRARISTPAESPSVISPTASIFKSASSPKCLFQISAMFARPVCHRSFGASPPAKA